MALRTAASLQRALSNSDDGDMFWDYGQAAGLRAGMFCASCHAPLRCIWPPASQPAICILGRTVSYLVRQHNYLSSRQRSWVSGTCVSPEPPLFGTNGTLDFHLMHLDTYWSVLHIRIVWRASSGLWCMQAMVVCHLLARESRQLSPMEGLWLGSSGSHLRTSLFPPLPSQCPRTCLPLRLSK